MLQITQYSQEVIITKRFNVIIITISFNVFAHYKKNLLLDLFLS